MQEPDPRVALLETELEEERRRAQGLVALVGEKEQIRMELEREIMSKVTILKQNDAKFLKQKSAEAEHAKCLERKNEQIASLETKINTLTTNSDSSVKLKNELATAQSTIEKQAWVIAAFGAKYDKLQVTCTNFEDELSQVRSEIEINDDEHASAIADLTNQCNETTMWGHALEGELFTATEKYNGVVDQFSRLEQNHMGLQEKYDELVLTSEAGQAKLTASQNAIIAEAESHAVQLQENEKAHNAVVEKLQKVHEEVTADRDSLQTQLTTTVTTKDSEIEQKVKDYNGLMERFASLEKEKDAAVTALNSLNEELTKLQDTITKNDEEHASQITKMENEHHELVAGLKKKHEENITQHNSDFAALQTQHDNAISKVYLLEECRKLKAPLYTFNSSFDLLWSRFGFLVLLALMTGFLASFGLPSGHAIYETILSFFSPTEIAPAPVVLSPSVDAFARLQSVLAPVCMDMVSIGPDVSTEFITPESCSGMYLVCWLSKGWQWVGSHLW